MSETIKRKLERNPAFGRFTSRDLVDIGDKLKDATTGGPQMMLLIVMAELEARHPEIGRILDTIPSANSTEKFEAVRPSIPMGGCGCAI